MRVTKSRSTYIVSFVFVLSTLIFAPSIVAANSSKEIVKESTVSSASPSPSLNLNGEIKDETVLNEKENKLALLIQLEADYDQVMTNAEKKGDAGNQNVFRKQAYDTNNKIRNELQRLILTQNTEEERLQLFNSVQKQITEVERGINFSNDKLSSLETEFLSTKPEDQSLVLNKIDLNQSIAQDLLRDRWENQRWLNQLGVPDPIALEESKKSLKEQLEFIVSALQNYNSDKKQVTDLLRSTIESEKSKLQLQESIIQRRINMTTEQLSAMISLAVEMRIDTTEYKRILFETTAQFTNDLFDIKVIESLILAWTHQTKDWFMERGIAALLQVLVIVAIIWGGGKFGRVIERIAARMLKKPNLRMSRLMQAFLSKMFGRTIFFIALLIALNQIGINLAPLLTGLGVAGIVIGFALQDTLSNFASGIMLLLYRPFDVNDYVQAGGVSGKVSHMSLVNTTIKTFDNQIIIVPNKMIWGDIITNITHERVRRVDMIFSIGYKDNIDLAEKIFHDVLDMHEAILSQPERTVQLHVLGTSSLDFIVRPWVKTDDYWPVFWFVTREVKRRFDEAGINIPYPQQDVHLHVTEEYNPNQNEQLKSYLSKHPLQMDAAKQQEKIGQ